MTRQLLDDFVNLNDTLDVLSYIPIMTKLSGLALIAVAAFAVTSAYAGDKDKDKGCCATNASNSSKMGCSQTYAKLNLSAEQKVKMDALVAKCNKNGCTKESMDEFMKSAESILSKEQMATLKADCSKMQDKGAKA
jgi:hypothetical protein